MSNSQHKPFKIKRRRGACKSCKERKIRCNGERPCSTCHRGGLNCIYPVSGHRKSNQGLHPLTTTAIEAITTNQATSPPSQPMVHERNLENLDSDIADCDFPMEHENQLSLSVSAAVVLDNVPQLMSLEQTYKLLREPRTTGFVPIKSLLRHLQEQISNDDSIPAPISNCLNELVAKLETSRSQFQRGLNAANLSGLASDEKKLRVGVQNFFMNCNLGRSYLAKWNIDRILESSTKDSLPEDLMLLYGVVSLGYQTSGEDENSRSYAKLASDLSLEVKKGPTSVTKLQSLATLLLCHLHQSTLEMLPLVSIAINIIKTLELSTLSGIRDTHSREISEDSLKSLVWLLWSIEKILCLEENHVETFSIDTIEFPPPVQDLSTNHAPENVSSSLGIADLCEYAHICWNIVSHIKNKTRGRFSQPDTIRANDDVFIKSVVASLDNWKVRASQPLKGRECPEQTFSQSEQIRGKAKDMYLFNLYNNALLATLENLSACSKIEFGDRQQGSLSENTSSNLETARYILAHLNTTKNGVFVLESFTFNDLYMICWCIVFRGMMTGTGQQNDVTLLTISSGLFAQFALSTKLDPGYKEIADLGSAASSMVRNSDSGSGKMEFGSLDISSSSVCNDTLLLSETGTVGNQQTTQHSKISQSHLTDGTTLPELPDTCFSHSWLVDHDFEDQFWTSGLGSGGTWHMDGENNLLGPNPS